jgi:hypothetical protein
MDLVSWARRSSDQQSLFAYQGITAHALSTLQGAGGFPPEAAEQRFALGPVFVLHLPGPEQNRTLADPGGRRHTFDRKHGIIATSLLQRR